jgi:hypothetical protein
VWVCGLSFAGTSVSNPVGVTDVCVCCQVEVSASDRSLVQRSPTECSVSECDREASIMRMPWPTGGRMLEEGWGQKLRNLYVQMALFANI